MNTAVQLALPIHDGEKLSFPTAHLSNPFDYPICTRLPLRFQVYSAWVAHIPFAMFLIGLLRPKRLVELGSGWGVSYCAFCQAVKELRLATQCHAIDTWQGDRHAGNCGQNVLDDLKQHHDHLYSLFSHLIQASFDEACELFENDSIDLLHIDGGHSYEAVKHDFETWLPKLTPSSVVLFHDTEVRDRETFGVWRFWDEIKETYPHFEFYHSYGLGVLAPGKHVPEALSALLCASKTDAEKIRQFFANLGERITLFHDLSIQKSNLEALVDAKAAECVVVAEALKCKTSELERYRMLVPVLYRTLRGSVRWLSRLGTVFTKKS
jgi:hypothetical protein